MSKKPNIRINKVYTRKGDSGKTDLIDQKKVLKSDIRIDCYGEVDELNSSIGFCIALISDSSEFRDKNFILKLKKIQNDLFNLGTVLAVSDISLLDKFPKINKSNIDFIENEIDYYNKELSDLKSFILPSGSLSGAYFHVCRTICRRVERKCVSLSEIFEIDQNILKYLNRLSDLFFVLSRWINKEKKSSEDLWMP
tara:strand:- start:2510 stop:3097 length:588 start_codon:yes stop_codon:yes gene_type:complete